GLEARPGRTFPDRAPAGHRYEPVSREHAPRQVHGLGVEAAAREGQPEPRETRARAAVAPGGGSGRIGRRRGGRNAARRRLALAVPPELPESAAGAETGSLDAGRTRRVAGRRRTRALEHVE